MWKLLLFIALNFRRNEGSDGKVTLQFITWTVKLPQQKWILSIALTGINWRGCYRDRTVKCKHFQKSQKLSICGVTENKRTTVWEHARVGPVFQELRTSSWSGRRITRSSLCVSEVSWVEHYALGFRVELLEAKDRCISPFPKSVN